MAGREREQRPIPAHPYRDTAIVYGIMAVLLVVLAGITGGSLLRAVAVGGAFWVAATAWSWWKFRGRIRTRDAARAAAAPSDATPSDASVVHSLAPERSETVVETGLESAAPSGTVNGTWSAKP